MVPYINLLHVLIIAPLIFYVTYQHNYGTKDASREVYNLLMLFAIIAFFYHGFRAITVMKV